MRHLQCTCTDLLDLIQSYSYLRLAMILMTSVYNGQCTIGNEITPPVVA